MVTRARVRAGRPAALSLQQRAELFAQLAALEDAGLPAAQALTTLQSSARGELATRARAVAKALAGGRDLADSGLRAGLFAAAEADLVRAATTAGSPAPVYRRLAQRYRDRAEHARAIKGRSLMPLCVLVLAVFVAPLPGLVLGRTTAGEYLGQTLAVLLALALAAYLVLALPSSLRTGSLAPLGLGGLVDRLLIHVPILGPAHVRRQTAAFLETLGLMLEAGIPALEALPKAAAVVDNRHLRTRFRALSSGLEAGRGVAGALADSPYVSATALALLSTGEAAGRLPQALHGFSRQERQSIRLFDTQVADWLPRILYLCVAAWMAGSLLSGGLP